jgi:hypothetical protein
MPLNESKLETKNDDGVDDSHAESIIRMATEPREGDEPFSVYERLRAAYLDIMRAASIIRMATEPREDDEPFSVYERLRVVYTDIAHVLPEHQRRLFKSTNK